MANDAKKSRCSNWSHEETMVLAELKKDTFFNKKEGRLVWEQIAQTMSSLFPKQKRSHDQCRRRWETLRKVYNHIEYYCIQTGQDHWELDEGELSSMKLDTAYRQDWYNIVKQVCSQHKRKGNDLECDLIYVKPGKRSEICSPSAVLPKPTAGRDSLNVTPPVSICEPVIATLDADHEKSTTVNGQISTKPCLEVEKASTAHEEEIRRLKIQNDDLILELSQLRQHRQVTQQDQVLQNFPAEVRAHVKEPLQDVVLDSREVTVDHPSPEAEQDGTACELMVPPSSHRLGVMNLAGCTGFEYLFDSSSTLFSTPISFPKQDGLGGELMVPRSRTLSPSPECSSQHLEAMNSAGCSNDFYPFDSSSTCSATHPSISTMECWDFDFSPATFQADEMRNWTASTMASTNSGPLELTTSQYYSDRSSQSVLNPSLFYNSWRDQGTNANGQKTAAEYSRIALNLHILLEASASTWKKVSIGDQKRVYEYLLTNLEHLVECGDTLLPDDVIYVWTFNKRTELLCRVERKNFHAQLETIQAQYKKEFAKEGNYEETRLYDAIATVMVKIREECMAHNKGDFILVSFTDGVDYTSKTTSLDGMMKNIHSIGCGRLHTIFITAHMPPACDMYKRLESQRKIIHIKCENTEPNEISTAFTSLRQFIELTFLVMELQEKGCGSNEKEVAKIIMSTMQSLGLTQNR